MIGRRPPHGRKTPAINLPPATKAVAGIVILVFLLALVPSLDRLVYDQLYFEPLAPPLGWVAGAATYGLLHGDAMHLMGNLLGLVVLGPLAERRHGWSALLTLLLAGAFAGAAAHTVVQLVLGGGSVGLIGASAAVAALIGWSLRQIRDRRGFGHLDQAVTLYGVFFIVFNLIGVLAFNDSPVAYSAHAGGFALGWFYPRRAMR